MRFCELEGRRVAVWGCGREGRAALKAVHARLPELQVTLLCSEDEARQLRAATGSMDTIPTPAVPVGRESERAESKPSPSRGGVGGDGFPVQLAVVTSTPDVDTLASFDVVIKSPGISVYKPEIRAAQARGTQFTSGTALWFGERPDARVVGVTGTKGKSTTSALLAHCARSLGVRTALAGNLGLPLLELLDAQAELWVVELSSFQTRDAGSLEVGVITSLYQEHLDWHGSAERYVTDKLQLADAARTLLVNATQPELLARTASHPNRVLFGGDDGWTVRDGDLYRGEVVMDPSLTALNHLPGIHNAINACAALAALDALHAFDGEFTRDDVVHSLADFEPLPHRLQPLGQRDGRVWINDSISTAPPATLAALSSLAGRAVTLIVGGHDRGLDWSEFSAAVRAHPPHAIIAQGANGARIAAAVQAAGVVCSLALFDDLDTAVACARATAPESGVILLSPGAPSFDQFRDYTERGRRFADLAGFDAAQIIGIDGLGVA